MKRIILCVLALCLLFYGCSTNNRGSNMNTEESINKIDVTERTVKRDDIHAKQYEEWVIRIENNEYHIEKHLIK